MYDLIRLQTMLRLSSHIFIVFILLNTAMWVTTTLSPEFLSVPKQFFGVDFVKQNYQKVHDLIRYRQNSKSNYKPLYAFLGLSGASEGIDTAVLRQSTNEQIDIISLSGAGRNIKEIDIYAEPLINSQLMPELVAFAISPFHVMEPPVDTKDLLTKFRKTSAQQLLSGWLSQKRNDLKHLIDMNILKVRLALSNYFNYGLDTSTNATKWQDDILMNMKQLKSTTEWEVKLEQYENRGYYSLDNYQNSQKQINLLIGLTKQFQNKGAEVIYVLMPEHSSLHQKIPQQALRNLNEQLNSHFQGDRKPNILDYRQAIIDAGFNDISHLNKIGRETFSSILITLIERKQGQL